VTSVHDSIPEGLKLEVEAALAWFNRHADTEFEVTGIVDPEAALEMSGSREIRLILCGGDRCEPRSFRVTRRGDDYDVALLDDDAPIAVDGPPPAELDPPPGALREWLDRRLAGHAFLVLVFYRGFW